MNRSSKTLRLGAVGATAALVLAACGGSGTKDEGMKTPEPSKAPVAKADGTLTIGSLLPETGSLSFLGPPEFAGVDLAIKDINAAGGVLGKDVVGVKADSGDTDSGIAPAETDKLLKAKSDVIVGAASSGVSFTVIDKIMNAGVVQISPANTSTDFDLKPPYNKPDLYFRTAPSDILQGAVLANLMLQDGRQNVAILARQDAYGETLAKQTKMNLEKAGAKVSTLQFYGEKAQSFDAQVSKVAASKPDAIALIAFDETVSIIPQLIQAGVGPLKTPTYFVDGNTANYGKGDTKTLPDGTLKGVKGTIPGVFADDAFKKRLATVTPNLKDYAYAAESYDAVVTAALAATEAKSDAGTDIAKHMIDVTEGGTKCKDFTSCSDLLAKGTDIDYDGLSGPIELGKTGSPTAASIGIWQYDGMNKIQELKLIPGKI